MADPGRALESALARVRSEAPDYVRVLEETGDSLQNTSSGLLGTLFAALSSDEDELSPLLHDYLRRAGRRRAAQGIEMEAALQVLDIHRNVVLESIEDRAAYLPDSQEVVLQAQRRIFLTAERLIASWADGYGESVQAQNQEDQLRLRRLFAIARAVHRSLDAVEIGRAGLVATLEAMSLDVGGIWSVSASDDLMLLAGHGFDEAAGRLLAEGLVTEVVTAQGPQMKHVKLSLAEGNARVSAVALGLRFEGQVLGAMVVGSRKKRTFPRIDLDFLSEVARQVAVALAHAREARTDHLTGLSNRSEFERSMDREMALAKRHGRPLSLLLLDLDSLKTINDRHGHAAGDLALRAVGEAVRGVVRSTDISARLGGDEFAIAFPEASPGQAWEVGTRLRESLAEIGRRLELPEPLAISLGVAEWRRGMPWDALYRTADATLYEEKRHHHAKLVRSSSGGGGDDD
jgi:diguanylate cyclase (GGDEF)-like protein